MDEQKKGAVGAAPNKGIGCLSETTERDHIPAAQPGKTADERCVVDVAQRADDTLNVPKLNDATRARITALEAQIVALQSDWSPMAKARARSLRAELIQIRRGLSAALARSRGWRVATTPFTLGELRREHHDKWYKSPARSRSGIDHADYYRRPPAPYRPAAILTHSYMPPDQLRAWAAEQHLRIELLPWSWYCPTPDCTAAILTTNGLAKGKR